MVWGLTPTAATPTLADQNEPHHDHATPQSHRLPTAGLTVPANQGTGSRKLWRCRMHSVPHAPTRHTKHGRLPVTASPICLINAQCYALEKEEFDASFSSAKAVWRCQRHPPLMDGSLMPPPREGFRSDSGANHSLGLADREPAAWSKLLTS